VYHFLVPDADMAPFAGDKVLAELEPKGVERLKVWRKAMQQPFTPTEVLRLQKVSAALMHCGSSIWRTNVRCWRRCCRRRRCSGKSRRGKSVRDNTGTFMDETRTRPNAFDVHKRGGPRRAARRRRDRRKIRRR
jgi:hypothetical protein